MSGIANKDEALRCLSIAEKALQAGDLEKAERFGQKAKKLCECDEVRLFLRKLSPPKATAGPSRAAGQTSSSTSAAAAEGLRKRNASQPSTDSRPKATPEQIALVKRIRDAEKDYYKILAIEKDASDEDIKRAYKKLALKLHPDKNSAPGADEAFKSVSGAFSCLSDPEKRSNYDRFGFEDRQQAAAARGHHYQYADEIDPQEIFNMFFGGGFPMHGHGRVYQTHFGTNRRRHHYSNAHNRENNRNQTQPSWTSYLQLIPILFLFLFTFLQSPQQKAPFSVVREYPYRVEMTTERHKIPFYVQDRYQFQKDYPLGGHHRRNIESQVESTMKRYWQIQCNEETRRQRRLEFWSGKSAGHGQNPSCKAYEQHFGRAQPVR